MRAHSQRYLATEPATLKFEIMVPHDQADTVMLYEIYASPEAFETHWHGPAKQEANRDFEPLRVSVSFVRCDLWTLQSTASFISDVIFWHQTDMHKPCYDTRYRGMNGHSSHTTRGPEMTRFGHGHSRTSAHNSAI